jgi:hypothetical protein
MKPNGRKRVSVLTPSRTCALVLALVGAIVLSGCLKGKTKVTRDEGANPPMDASLFQRDQPVTRRVFKWDGQVIVEADRFYSLDLEQGVVAPVRLPGAREVIGLASNGPGRALALCRDSEGLALLAHENGKWDRLELPEELRRSAHAPTLCADASSVVLLGKEKLFRLAEGGWESVALKERPETRGFREEPSRVLLAGETLYLGFARGEWGGGLLSLELSTGEWQEVVLGRGFHLPVTDLEVGPGGTVWAVEGLAHFATREGVLHHYDGREWKMVCKSSEEGKNNWDLPTASLVAVSFDAEGTPYLLSGCLGLVRSEGENWTRLTPGWPEYAYVSSLYITPEGVAVVGMSDAGVLLFDLRSKQARRVALRE